MRCIAHLDMDAFYVSVELQRRPALKGLPVIVSGSGPRAVVTTASYEARKFGVGSAIPFSRAQRLCPQAVVIAPDHDAYRETSRRVMAILRSHVERVEGAGLDEAYLDLTGLLSPRAEMRRLIRAIRDQTGLNASVGIGPNKLVAKVASDAEKPQGFVVLSREQACERWALASPGLIPGIGPKTVERLTKMGITTLAGLATTPEETLVGSFGPNHGRDLLRRARFEHDGTVEPVRVAVSESRETTFPQDIADRGELEAIMARLAGQLAEALVKQARRGRTIGIKVRLDDWTTVTRARTIPAATNDAVLLRSIALELLREYAPARPVRLLGVRIAAFEPAATVAQDAGGPQLALPV